MTKTKLRVSVLAPFLLLAAGLPALAEDGATLAKANIATYSKLPTFSPPGPAFDAKACMANKSIFTVPASSAIPFIQTIIEHEAKLADTIGFKHKEWENQGNPTQWIQGIEYAVNNKFNLISLLAGADPRFFQPQVIAAQAAGVKVVTSHLTGLEQKPPTGVDAALAIDYRKAGELMADWTIAKTGGKTNALVVVSNEALSTDSIVSGLTEAFKTRCPNCVFEIVNVPITDWATRIQPTVAGALQANAKLNYVIPIYDSMSTFVTPAIAISGRTDVKVATFNGTPFVLDLIRTGEVEMDIGENLDWIAHAMIDAEMRILCGLGLETVVNTMVPLRVFSADNVADVGKPADAAKGYGDTYVAGYRSLWKMK